MATLQELETVKSVALYEQMLANSEQRRPDIETLDNLAFAALHELAPVACITDQVQYLGFDPKVGNFTEPVESFIPISGRFGGFKILQETVSEPGLEDIFFMRLHYFVSDTVQDETGYLCPVENTTLIDVVSELEDDDEFTTLHSLIRTDPLDMQAIYRFFIDSTASRQKIGMYTAYLRAVMMPSEIFTSVEANGYYCTGEDKKKALEYIPKPLSIGINKFDVFTVGDFGVTSQEVAIRRGNYPCLYIPLGVVIDYEYVKRP